MAEPTPTRSESASTSELVSRVSSEVSRLIRDALRLAQAEMTQKTKKAIAALLALSGERSVSAAGPPVPEQAISEVKANVETEKESASR